ncbi:Allantoicase [Dissostichus eleginoides]|uniref:Allantoate amidinohydrolase n=1 Tax=Dissostichus eleginoides TaxID=100907 RepID=A0AAD9AZP7_DISEL|nr:Allantoicase [Dissostichus eleginoides]
MAERRAKAAAEPHFLQFNDLACEAVGGKVIFATDEWFAPAANLLKREQPVFIASAFTEFGKWMDGWETRRKRTPGHDWCIVALGVPGLIHGFDVDTSFFTGNHSPHVSIQAACLDPPPTFSLEGDRTGMAASDAQLTAVAKVTRRDLQTRVYGVGQRDWSDISPNQDVDLLALTNGGVCLGYSDAHFGHPRNMIGLGRGVNMADGWETARRLDRPKHLEEDEHGVLLVPGWEWAVFRLGHPGVIRSVELDTDHFKGTFRTPAAWRCLRADHHHVFDEARSASAPPPATPPHHPPDGGISRLRLIGRLAPTSPSSTNQEGRIQTVKLRHTEQIKFNKVKCRN